MANEKNLVPFTSEQSHEEAVKNGRKGGIASGEAKRNRKMLRDCIDYLLEREDAMVLGTDGNPMSGAEQLAYNLFVKALAETDTAKAAKAFEVLTTNLLEGTHHLAPMRRGIAQIFSHLLNRKN